MKIINESEFEIKCIKDLDIGEIFIYGAFAYMKVNNPYCKAVGYPALRLTDGEIIYMTDGWAQIKLLDAELHIKYKIKKD